MPTLDLALLVVAGVGAGLSGSIAGLSSLVSYPALLGLGLSPVAANVTNTIALVAQSSGSVLASRPELTGQQPRLRRLAIVTVAGGMAGGLLLLLAPADSFELVVPWLIAAASLGVLIQPRTVAAEARRQPSGDSRLLDGAAFVVAAYGGYFGAAAGVMMLAILMAGTGETFPRSNAAKNVLLGAANAVAAVAFMVFGPVHWEAVVPLAIGLFAGGWLGPRVVRRVPTKPLRVLIATGGIGLAIHLGLDAYR